MMMELVALMINTLDKMSCPTTLMIAGMEKKTIWILMMNMMELIWKKTKTKLKIILEYQVSKTS